MDWTDLDEPVPWAWESLQPVLDEPRLIMSHSNHDEDRTIDPALLSSVPIEAQQDQGEEKGVQIDSGHTINYNEGLQFGEAMGETAEVSFYRPSICFRRSAVAPLLGASFDVAIVRNVRIGSSTHE
jgi:hypothetical protein